MKFPVRIIAVCGLMALTECAMAASVRAPHIEAELIAENTALKPEGENWLALRLKPDAGWHTYWINAGDAGYATALDWKLPAGVRAGALQWPAPETHRLGELTTYGYGGETLHLVRLDLSTGAVSPVVLRAKARWLVCSEEVCIPGDAELNLTLPVAGTVQADARWAEKFAEARSRLPREIPTIQGLFSIADGALSLKISGYDPAADSRLQFFPESGALVNHSSPQRLTRGADGFVITQMLSDYYAQAPAQIRGALVEDRSGRRLAFAVTAIPGPATVLPNAPAGGPKLGLMLGFALLGGLILNLMPCVFPVLSLKALAVMQARDVNHAHVHHALSYTAGVVLSCVAVAGVLLALRTGGAAIGWGYQFQTPVFVAALIYLMFTLGLAMSGAVELGSRLAGIGQSLTQKTGLVGSFFTGVLATVVASPCTAPYMSAALGYALTQSNGVALMVFATLGVGLALPFLLLGFFPALARLLPRPGAWMLTFKQFMAFPLYLTAVWLLWVLVNQTGADGALLIGVGLVLIVFALWLWPRTGTWSRLLRYSALAGALALLAHPTLRGEHATEPATNAWSETRVAELRAQGRTIFVDFTADWCLTCKLNERAVLHTDAVRAAFLAKNVAFLVADWTNPDEAIARKLDEFRHPGVPMYLVYVNGGEPRLLPQVLTPDIVIDALEK